MFEYCLVIKHKHKVTFLVIDFFFCVVGKKLKNYSKNEKDLYFLFILLFIYFLFFSFYITVYRLSYHITKFRLKYNVIDECRFIH